MTNKKINEESKLTYDDRRKVLIQEKSQISNNETAPENSKDKPKHLSTVKQSMKVEYTEEGIRLSYGNLIRQKKNAEKRIAEIEKNDMPEMPKELKEIKEKLEELAKYQKVEKQKEEYKAIKENLKEVNKDIKEITDAIGTRLKL